MQGFQDKSVATLALIGLMLGAIVIVAFPLYDPDIYWHLANGRAMVAEHRIVNEEIFSFTKAGTAFSNHEWLAQLLFYAIYDTFGWTGLQVFKVLVGVGVAVVVAATCRYYVRGAALCALLAFAAVLAGAYRYSVRPELFSLLLLAVAGWILHGYRANQRTSRALWALPFIVVVWDWLHGALYGVIAISIIAIGENLKHWLTVKYPAVKVGVAMPAERLRPFNFWMAVTALCFAVNPYGVTSYDIFVEFLRPNPQIAAVREFSAPSFQNFVAFWVFVTFGAVVVAARRRRIDLADAAVVLVFLALALRFNRVIGVFAIVAAPVLASLLAGGAATALDTPRRQAALRIATTAFAVLTLGTAVYVKFFKPNDVLQLGFRVLTDGFPVGAAQRVRDLDLRGNLYNSGDFGGYLAFALAPERKIFQYNHHAVFRDTQYYVDHPSEFEQWNINYAIVSHGIERRVLFPQNQWAEIYSEPVGALMIRRTPDNQPIIDRYEVRYFHPLRMGLPELTVAARNPAIYPQLMTEMAVHLSARPDPVVAQVFTQFIADPGGLLSIPQKSELVILALRANPDDPGLRHALDGLRGIAPPPSGIAPGANVP